MKISKTAVLTLGGVFATAGLGFMFVSAADKNLFMDLNNAVQHFVEVKFVESGNDDGVMIKRGGNTNPSIDINSTNLGSLNFILTKTGASELNKISNSKSSSILGGIHNTINGKDNNVILGGNGNTIKGSSQGYNNVILGGNGNTIQESSQSTILGGNGNTVNGGYYQTVIGNGNTASATSSVTIGKNNKVNSNANNSVALGSNATVSSPESFIWSDGTSSTLGAQAFAVLGDGMAVNTDKAHAFAKLTIGGSLRINELTNLACTSVHEGVVKMVANGTKKCFCSCDGTSWNSLNGGGACASKCDSNVKPSCGSDVSCGGDTPFKYEGSCNRGKVVEGDDAYFIDKSNKLHWACEEEDGSVVFCEQPAPTNCNVTVPEPDCDLPAKSCKLPVNGDANLLRQSAITQDDNNYYWTCYYGAKSKSCTLAKKSATLKYNGNSCGTAPGDVPLTYADPVYAASMVSITSGMGFQKWCTQPSGGGYCYTPTQQVKAPNTTPNDMTLYAICSNSCDKDFTVTYDKNGGDSVTTPTATVHRNNSVNLNVKATKSTCDFVGWNTDSAATQALTSYIMPCNNVRLYAIYGSCSRPNPNSKCSITFHSNGGSEVSPNPQELTCEEKGTKPTDPSKTCNVFNGWYTSSALTTAYNWNDEVEGHIDLYAKWTKNQYTVTYDKNGGKSVTSTSAKVYYGDAVDLTVKATPESSEYSFIGWNTDKNAKTALDSYTMPCGNVRLYAIYSNGCDKDFTVTYNKNGGKSVTPTSAKVHRNNSVNLNVKATPQDGYGFIGWNTDSNATTVLSSYTMPCENKALYAIYTKFACINDTPAHSVLVNGTDKGLTSNAPKKLVPYDYYSLHPTEKCLYNCDRANGFYYDSNKDQCIEKSSRCKTTKNECESPSKATDTSEDDDYYYWNCELDGHIVNKNKCKAEKEKLECSGGQELPDGAYYYDGYEFNDEPSGSNNKWKYVDLSKNYLYELDPEYADYYKDIRNTPCSWTCKRGYTLKDGECVLDSPCRYPIGEQGKNMYEGVYKSKLCIDGWTADISSAGVQWNLEGGNSRCEPYFVWKCKKSGVGTYSCDHHLTPVYINSWKQISPYGTWGFANNKTLYDPQSQGYPYYGEIPGGDSIKITMGYTDKQVGDKIKNKTFWGGDVLDNNFDSVYGVLYYNVDPWLVNLKDIYGYDNWKVVSPVISAVPYQNHQACPQLKTESGGGIPIIK